MVAHSQITGFVYFMGGLEGPIKIGYSSNPAGRLPSIQTGSPVRLFLLCSMGGSLVIERMTHKAIASDRLHGEWFRRPAVLRMLEVLDSRLIATPWPLVWHADRGAVL